MRRKHNRISGIVVPGNYSLIAYISSQVNIKFYPLRMAYTCSACLYTPFSFFEKAIWYCELVPSTSYGGVHVLTSTVYQLRWGTRHRPLRPLPFGTVILLHVSDVPCGLCLEESCDGGALGVQNEQRCQTAAAVAWYQAMRVCISSTHHDLGRSTLKDFGHKQKRIEMLLKSFCIPRPCS